MERTVVFINPGDISYATKPDVLYMGDLKQRSQYPENSKISCFVSLSRWTQVLAPLLALSEAPVIHIERVSDDRRITVKANARTPEVDEYIDYFLYLSSPNLYIQGDEGDLKIYRQMLGPAYEFEPNRFHFLL
jgi:hypothetical protein